MTSIEATLFVALGGFLFALVMGGLGAAADEHGAKDAAKACLGLAMFGAGTCLISLGKAMLMYIGV